MRKPLSQMTLEELWQLFPISLVPPDERWQGFYAEMEAALRSAMAGLKIVRISHIGSTAIKGIWAKNIVDILLEAAPEEELKPIADAAGKLGFICMHADCDGVSMNFGYTPQGFADKVYHLHIRRAGNNDELYFRDYLNDHPHVAQRYEQLKLSLWKAFEHDRDGYTNAKHEFVTAVTAEAKLLYQGRY